MAGRKLLYIIRRPLTAGDAEELLPGTETGSLADSVSVVLLDAAIADTRPFPGRIFILLENPDVAPTRPDAKIVSYGDLLQFMFDADSTIVI